MAAGGQCPLQPPGATEIGQLIRRPAAAAGLHFEEDAQHGARLDDLLRDAAIKGRDSLPLLEFTLEELFHQRRGSLLTLTAYRQLGGVEGAIGRRADEVFSKLPPDAQASLPHVFRQLVAIGGDDGETVMRRPAPIEQFDRIGPNNASASGTVPPAVLPPMPARTFVDAFIAARLFTAKEQAGVPVVEVSHEALLSRWKQVVDWLETDKKLLRHRASVERAAAKWLASGRKSDLLLPPGTPLDEGQELLRVEFPITGVERNLVNASTAEAQRGRLVRRLTLTGLGALILLATGLTISNTITRRHNTELVQTQGELQQAKDKIDRISYDDHINLAQLEWKMVEPEKACGILDVCPLNLRRVGVGALIPRVSPGTIQARRAYQYRLCCRNQPGRDTARLGQWRQHRAAVGHHDR